jgi:ribosomal protein L11 methyltransferase
LSVSVEDADADTDAEQALFGEPGMPAPKEGWQRSTLKCLFETEAAATEAATLLLAQDFLPRLPGAGPAAVADQDWVRLTQSQFAPVEITPSFWIVPTWHEPPARRPHRDPARPGPGLWHRHAPHHPHVPALDRAATRRRWAARACWTTAAARASWPSARPAWRARTSTRSTSTRRRWRPPCQCAGQRRALRAGLPDKASGTYPLVLANILATPLKLLAPLLCGHVAPGGHLVLAGILERQADELKAAYAPWLALEVADTEDGWILMTDLRLPGV